MRLIQEFICIVVVDFMAAGKGISANVEGVSNAGVQDLKLLIFRGLSFRMNVTQFEQGRMLYSLLLCSL